MDLKDFKQKLAEQMIDNQQTDQPTLFFRFIVGLMVMLSLIMIGRSIIGWIL